LKTKLKKFNHIYGEIRTVLNKRARKETHTEFYKTVAISTLTYSSETKTLTK
jgi:hypothetical protein